MKKRLLFALTLSITFLFCGCTQNAKNTDTSVASKSSSIDSHNASTGSESSNSSNCFSKVTISGIEYEIASDPKMQNSVDVNKVKKLLEIPDDLDVSVEMGAISYWDVGETYCVEVTFTHNGETVATAQVNPTTSELIKEIYKYQKF